MARLTLTGTRTGPFAGRDATGRFARWSSRISGIDGGKVVQTWAMQDRLAVLEQLGALPELQPVNWAGGRQSGDRSGRP